MGAASIVGASLGFLVGSFLGVVMLLALSAAVVGVRAIDVLSQPRPRPPATSPFFPGQ